jgi:peptidoglycan biosynthesis protein MviN/MurJ (putative lipid II flippase)
MLWLLPYFVFQQMVNITQALLNTYESYFYPDIISLLASIINILFIVLFAQSIGIYALVIATSINYGLLILVLCCLLHRKVPDFSIFPHLGLKKAVPFLTFSLPVYLAMFTVQMYAMVERATCSKFGEGAVSLYDYAHQIMNLPNVVFSSIVPIVLTPLLSKYHIDGMGQAFSSEYRKFMRMLLVFTIIVGEVMIVNRCDISILFFNKNNVDFENLEIALGITIFFVIVNLICGQALIAQSRIKQYVTGIVLGNVLSILACLSLNSLFPLYAIAICYIIGQIVSMVILLHFLQIEEKGKSLSDIGFLLLIFIGTCCLALFVSSQVHQEGGKMAAIINILTFSTCEILLIGGLYFTFFKEERKTLLNFIHSKH